MIEKLEIDNIVEKYNKIKQRLVYEIYSYLMDNYRLGDKDEYGGNYYKDDVYKKIIIQDIHYYMDKIYPLFRSELNQHLINMKHKILWNPKSFTKIRKTNLCNELQQILFPKFTKTLNQFIFDYFREYDQHFFDDKYLNHITHYIWLKIFGIFLSDKTSQIK
jgi:hypothetical protein